MTKAAAKKKRTTTSDESVEGYIDQINAKRLFLSSSINMGWQLAVTVIVPLVGGIKIDQHFNTSPNFTLAGIILAIAAGSTAVWSNIKQVNQDLKELEDSDESNT